MSDRSNFYYEQECTCAEFNQAFDDVENADHSQAVDRDIWGVVAGLLVTESAVPDLFINIADGFAYDETGRRIPHTTGPAKIDMTSYLPAASPKWVRVYIQSQIILGDSRVDGLGNPVDYREVESFQWIIDEGAEGGGVPALLADHVLLCQIQLTVAMGSIANADIDDSVEAGERQAGGLVIAGRVNTLAGMALGAGDDALLFGPDVALRGMGHVDGYNAAGADGDVRRMLSVHARSPNPGASPPEGHVYGNSAGALVDVSKYASIDAATALPAGPAPGDPWDGAGNYWYLTETSKKGSPLSFGDLGWRYLFGSATPLGSKALYFPIEVPNGAKLIDCRAYYSVDGAGMVASHVLRMWILRRGSANVDVIGADPPSSETNAAPGNYSWLEALPTHASQIVNNDLYSYFAAIEHYTPSAVGTPEDVIRIKFVRVHYHVREASGVY